MYRVLLKGMKAKQQVKRIEVFSALEVATLCGVVNQTAINWIKAGYLKSFETPGGQYRVYKDDLYVFMKERGMRIPDELKDSSGLETDWRSILVIDDDESLNNAIVAFLEKHLSPFTVIQSFDGFDAGTQLAEKKPGFIILDLELPGVNGQDLCKRIKTDPSFGKPIIIVITALDDEGLEQKMYDFGVDMFYKKPLNLKDLRDYIQSIFETI